MTVGTGGNSMRKMIYHCAAICVGLSVLSAPGEAQGVAQPQPSNTAARPIQVDRAFYPKNPYLLELEQKLRKVVLGAQPGAKIEFIANYLVVHYRSDKFRKHLTNSLGDISTDASEQYPASFSEFLLDLRVDNDVMYYRPDNVHKYKPETFGTTLTRQYNLKVLPDFKIEDDEPNVPCHHWVYMEYDKLVKAGLLPNRYPEGFYSGPPLEMTRYEFAVAIARLLEAPIKNTQDNNLDVENAITALQKEFAPELVALGYMLDPTRLVIKEQIWRPRYEHISLRFSYGKGVNAALVQTIEQIINDYAVARSKESAVAGSALTHK